MRTEFGVVAFWASMVLRWNVGDGQKLPFVVDAFEPVSAPWLEIDSRSDEKVLDRSRDEHLARSCQ